MKILAFTFLFLAAFVCANAQTDTTKYLHGTSKTPKKVMKQIRKGKALLIDVRTPDEFKAGHLEKAQNIDFKSADFKQKITGLSKKKPVYLYCRTGNRSGKALDTLKAAGYEHAYNIGGFEKLKKAGF